MSKSKQIKDKHFLFSLIQVRNSYLQIIFHCSDMQEIIKLHLLNSQKLKQLYNDALNDLFSLLTLGDEFLRKNFKRRMFLLALSNI